MKQMKRIVAVLLAITILAVNSLPNVSNATETEINDTETITGDLTTEEHSDGNEESTSIEGDITEEVFDSEEITEDSTYR